MFYDYEVEKASYQFSTEEIEREISLKRQYRIRGGKMKFMIESSLTVHDDILQRELSSNADDKMKDIVFADYISNVLPELGEETMLETSMEQILSEVLENKYKHQSFFDQVNELLTKPTSTFIDRIQYKISSDFTTSLDRFLLHVENHYFQAEDVKLTKHLTIPAGFIEKQFHRFHRYPMRQRFEAMTDYILDVMKVKYTLTITTAEKTS